MTKTVRRTSLVEIAVLVGLVQDKDYVEEESGLKVGGGLIGMLDREADANHHLRHGNDQSSPRQARVVRRTSLAGRQTRTRFGVLLISYRKVTCDELVKSHQIAHRWCNGPAEQCIKDRYPFDKTQSTVENAWRAQEQILGPSLRAAAPARIEECAPASLDPDPHRRNMMYCGRRTNGSGGQYCSYQRCRGATAHVSHYVILKYTMG